MFSLLSWKIWNKLNGACRRCQEEPGFNVIQPSLDLGKNRFRIEFLQLYKIMSFGNLSFKTDWGQIAPPKMTAMTIGGYPVFYEHIDLTRFLPLKSRSPRQTLISIFSYNWITSWGINILGGSYTFGRILGESSRRLHLLIRAICKGKCAIEHVAEDDWGQNQTGTFHLTLELGLRVVTYPNSTSRSGSWWEANCCVISRVNSMEHDALVFGSRCLGSRAQKGWCH